MKPRKGQTVQVRCDGRELLGTVFMEITEPSIVLLAPSGKTFVVPIKGSEFTAPGSDGDAPLREPPDDRG